MKQVINRLWVVYQMAVYGKHTAHHAICTQTEWRAMDDLQPGKHKLVRGGFANEGEAERFARQCQPLTVKAQVERSASYVRLSDGIRG